MPPPLRQKCPKYCQTKNIGFIARGITKGGGGRFVESILNEFNKLDGYNFYIFTDDTKYIEKYPNLNIVFIKSKNRLYWDLVKSLFTIKKYELDTLFYPKNLIPIIHRFLSCKKINIVHDLAYFDKGLNEYKFFNTLYFKLFVSDSCRVADKVLAVSDSTKKELIEYLRIPERKIHVVHEAVGEKFKRTDKGEAEQTISKYNIKTPFLFYCGSLSPRKNILNTLKAFNEISAEIPNNIYLASGQSWHDKPVVDYIKKHLSNRVFPLGFVTEKELMAFYTLADAYLYPSFYEGFGLPILEAQACGCPVLTSNKTSCPEVAGRGALIVDPHSISDIKNGILKILGDDKLRAQLIQEGHKNLERYSWKRTANNLLGVINNSDL